MVVNKVLQWFLLSNAEFFHKHIWSMFGVLHWIFHNAWIPLSVNAKYFWAPINSFLMIASAVWALNFIILFSWFAKGRNSLPFCQNSLLLFIAIQSKNDFFHPLEKKTKINLLLFFQRKNIYFFFCLCNSKNALFYHYT